jgi:release factor glutamine methyltransferase
VNVVIKHIIQHTYKPLLERYLSRTRKYTWKDIVLEIPPQVFHPGFFGSTGLLLRQLQRLEVRGKTLLELGAGSGLLSIYAAKKGAIVTATDINRTAIHYLHANREANGVELRVVHSDLFVHLPLQAFDYILINPPYYKRKPLTEKDYAWYCGEQGEYFKDLFLDLHHYTHSATEVYMSLCADCDINWIEQRAQARGWELHVVQKRQELVGKHFVFKLEHVHQQPEAHDHR